MMRLLCVGKLGWRGFSGGFPHADWLIRCRLSSARKLIYLYGSQQKKRALSKTFRGKILAINIFNVLLKKVTLMCLFNFIDPMCVNGFTTNYSYRSFYPYSRTKFRRKISQFYE